MSIPPDKVKYVIMGVDGVLDYEQYSIQKNSKEQQDEIDENGYGAELAFCKEYNLYPEFTYYARVGGCEIRTHKGFKIDVKNTVYPTGRLIAKESKKIGEADIYALLIGTMVSGFKFVGYATETDLLVKDNLIDLGDYGAPCFALTQNKLKLDIEKFI